MKNILIVDDNPQNLYMLQTLLSGNGYGIVEAANGAEALEKARSEPPDMIISDILMPVMDGFALCREWMKDKRLKPIPFIFYTATYTHERDREFALSLGAERFIVKPEEPDAFMAIVRETIQHVESPPAAGSNPAADAPTGLAIEAPKEEETVYLKQYNEALIRKLEVKMEQLERANRELEQDIAERKRAEKSLQDSELRFRSLVEMAPEAIFVQSEGRFVYLNPAMLRLFGASRVEALLGTEFMERIAPEYHEVVRERIRLQGQTEKPAPLMDQEYLHLNGSRIPVETTAVPVRFQGRNAYLVFVRDITARKQAEQQMFSLQVQLQQSQKMEAIGKLAGGVAHDFNNLLTVISVQTELCLRGLKDNNPLKENLKEVGKAAERAANLTRQLLAFSRRQILEMKVVNFNAILRDLEKMLFRVIGEDIELKTILADDLGMVKVDPGQMEQVIVNLAVNAKDAMPKGGKLSLETANAELDEGYVHSHAGMIPGAYILLSITDTGIGMTKEVQEQIFEPFFTTKEKGKGTGLGLSTVYGIVKQSGGDICVYSEPNKGTTFKVYLPRVFEPQEEFKKEAREEISRGTETVLVVEDDRMVRRLAIDILRRQGYRVLEASEGGEALVRCEKEKDPIDLILTDIVMPHMGGPELIERLRQVRNDFKVLYMSGYTDESIVRHGILEEGINLIQKPFTVDKLARKVREVLDKNKKN